MNYYHSCSGPAVAVTLTATLSACALFSEYRGCGSAVCGANAQITSEVESSFKEPLQLLGGDQLGVDTVDGVVYLTGRVLLDAQHDNAESIAAEIPGVRRVVNTLYVRATGGA